jgi:prepilin-type N-terminal cleavage/methylation domain-containing protein
MTRRSIRPIRPIRPLRIVQRGFTLIEVMISIAILSLMMTLAWATTSQTGKAKRTFEDLERRNHEIRVALARVVADLEAAYLSTNEDANANDPRTVFIGKADELRFSSLGHVSLWADANESEQTLISYSLKDRKNRGERDAHQDWLRRESRRLSNETWTSEPADLDVVLGTIEELKFEYWDWKDQKWRDEWDSTKADGQKGRLPERVRISVTFKNSRGDEIKLVTQARLMLQEPLQFFT